MNFAGPMSFGNDRIFTLRVPEGFTADVDYNFWELVGQSIFSWSGDLTLYYAPRMDCDPRDQLDIVAVPTLKRKKSLDPTLQCGYCADRFLAGLTNYLPFPTCPACFAFKMKAHYRWTFTKSFPAYWRWCPRLRRMIIILSREEFGSDFSKLPKFIRHLILNKIPDCNDTWTRSCICHEKLPPANVFDAEYFRKDDFFK